MPKVDVSLYRRTFVVENNDLRKCSASLGKYVTQSSWRIHVKEVDGTYISFHGFSFVSSLYIYKYK